MKLIFVLICQFFICFQSVYSLGDGEKKEDKKVEIDIQTDKSLIKMGDKFTITFIIRNKTNTKYGFTSKFFDINYAVNFYYKNENEVHLVSNQIIEPEIRPLKETFFLLKPNEFKSFSISYIYEKKNSIKHMGLGENYILTENTKEFFAKVIFKNNEYNIKLGEEKLGYNMYKDTLRSEKIKIIVAD